MFPVTMSITEGGHPSFSDTPKNHERWSVSVSGDYLFQTRTVVQWLILGDECVEAQPMKDLWPRLWSIVYPLVNVYITMENHHAINVCIWLVWGPPPKTIWGYSITRTFFLPPLNIFLVNQLKKGFQFTFNWFQFTFNWFQFTFNLLSIDFNLLSIYFQLTFNLLLIYFQFTFNLLSIYFQLISIYF